MLPQPPNRLKAVHHLILDWSGTLVDDLPAVWRASNHCFERAGIPSLPLEQFRSEFALPYEPFYRRYVPHVPLEQLEDWFQTRMRDLRTSVTELPHARPFLEWARQRGLSLHLLSAIHPTDFAAQVAENQFDRYFQSVHLRATDKLAVIGRLLAEQQLDPGATLYVGDMQHDVETARYGGIRSAAVLTGYNSRAQLVAARPDFLFEHLGELQTHLEAAATAPPEVRAKRFPQPTVGALIFNQAGEVLMIRTHKWSNKWGIPGGKIEWGEGSESALIREVLEETGLRIRDVRLILVQDAIHPPEFYRDAHFVLLNYTCLAPGEQPVVLNDEGQEHRWLRPEDASQLPLNTPTRVLLDHWRAQHSGLAKTSE